MAWWRNFLNNNNNQNHDNNIDRTGLAAAIFAYIIWGLMPAFFKQIDHIPAFEIVSHRVIWAVPLLIFIMAIRKQLAEYWGILKSWHMLRWMLLSSVLITTNWIVYVWAVNNDNILSASLGYYLNPLMNVALGTIFLKEHLSKKQWLAVALAIIAVAILAIGALDSLWISLTLAVSFCLYGFVRKLAPVGPVPGLAVETTILLPASMAIAFWFIFQTQTSGWVGDTRSMLFLIIGGGVTAIPLVFFAVAARRLTYSLLGFIQYIGPTLQFILGAIVYKEALDTPRLLAFALIWLGLIIFSSEAIRKSKAAPQS